jgi:hypothetical protein
MHQTGHERRPLFLRLNNTAKRKRRRHPRRRNTFRRRPGFESLEPRQMLAVTELRLLHDTGVSNSDLVTSDATLAGRISDSTGVAYRTVQFDLNCNGDPDVQTITDRDGNFIYSPLGLPLGAITIHARTKDWDYTQQQGTFSEWASIAFTLEAAVNQPPEVAALRLHSDTGELANDGFTVNPLLVGRVTNDGGVGRLLVEFDHDEDGVVDGVAFTDAQGEFQYRPTPLHFGAVTIGARAIEWDAAEGAYLSGPWTSLPFTYEDQPNAAPALVGLSLANQTGTASTTDPTLTGSINNEGALAGITIQFDYDGDGAADQSTVTDKSGNFRFTPAGLAYGNVTINVRTRELDSTTGSVLYGPWTAISFTYDAAVNAPAVVSELALENDTGYDDDLLTTDPTLIGQVTNDGSPSSLLVQFDHDGDELIEGSALTDAEGRFTYRPAGLSAGSVAIRARVKELTADGAPLYGDWLFFTFTLETAADPTLRVTQLVLANDTGASSSDRATADPTVSGEISAATADVPIEFDHNDDGRSDGTATTDEAGHFSYTPTGLGEGYVTIRARVAGGAAGWQSLNFVYASDPDGADAQDLLSAMNAHYAQQQATWSEFHLSLGGAASGYRLARHSAAAGYESSISDARGARNSAVTAATSTYHAAVSAADTAYSTALAAAGDALAVNIAAFAGDTSSFTWTDFAWPDAPVSGALTIPPDSQQPRPPADPPLYVGPEYNFDADQAYQTEVNDAHQIHNDAVAAAQAIYNTAVQDADAAYSDATAAAHQQNIGALAEAQQAYTAALAATHPTIDLIVESVEEAERRQQANDDFTQANTANQAAYDGAAAANDATYAAADAAAHAAYESTVTPAWNAYQDALDDPDSTSEQINAAFQNYIDTESAARITRDIGIAHARYQQEVDNAAAARLRDEQYAAIMHNYQMTLSASARIFEEKSAEHTHWVNEQKYNAEQALRSATADAAQDLAHALADAERAKADALAAAEETQTNAIAVAATTLRQAEAAAKHSALSQWSSSQSTPWAVYQTSLAGNELQFVIDVNAATLTHTAALTGADKTEKQAIALALKNEVFAIADANHTHTIRLSVALRNDLVAANDADLVRALTTAALWQDHKFDFSLAEFAYNMSMAELYETRTVIVAAGTRDTSIAAALNADNPSVYFYAALDASDELYFYEEMNARQTQKRDEYVSVRDFRLDYHAAEKTQIDAAQTAYGIYEVEVASAERDHQVAVVAAHGAKDNALAAAHTAWWNTVAPADKAFEDSLANFRRNHDVADAADLKTYQVNEATAYRSQISVWHSAQPSPWTTYQRDLAQAELDRVTAMGTANVEYVTEVGAARVSQTGKITTANKNYETTQAAAYETETNSVVSVRNTHAVTVADARLANATERSTRSTEHDMDVSAESLAYDDLLANEDQSLADAMITAQVTFIAESHAAYRALQAAIQAADGNPAAIAAANAAYTTRMDVAELARRIAEATVQQSYVNTIAGGRGTWTENTADLHVVWVDYAGQADDTLAADIKDAQVVLATAEAGAAKTREQTVQDARETRAVKHAEAGAAFEVDVAGAGAVLASASNTTGSAHREAVNAALGTYEVGSYTVHDAAVQAALSSLSPAESTGFRGLLAGYQAAVAAADVVRATNVADSRNSHNQALTAAQLDLTNATNTANLTQTNAFSGPSGISVTYATAIAASDKAWSIAFTDALMDEDVALRSAEAKRSEAGIKTGSKFNNDRAELDRTYANAMSAASVAWVATISVADYQNHVYQDGDAHTGASIAAANVRNQAHAEATVTRTEQLGDAHIARAEDLGEAYITYQTEVGDAHITYTDAYNAAETARASAVASAENQRAQSSASASTNHALSLAQAQRTMASAQASAAVPHQQRLGTAAVTRAGTIAQAEAAYQAGIAALDAAIAAALFLPVSTGEVWSQGAADAVHAEAYAAWIAALAADFVSYVTAAAQADADYDDAIAAATADRGNAKASADLSYTSAVEPLAGQRSVDVTAARQNFNQGQVSRENDRRLSLANGDKTNGVEHAEGDKQRGVDLTTIEKDYQVALAEADLGWVVAEGIAAAEFHADSMAAKQAHQSAEAAANSALDSALAAATTSEEIDAAYADHSTAWQTAQDTYTADMNAATDQSAATMEAAETARSSSIATAGTDRITRRADAELEHDTSEADSNLQWTFNEAAANETFTTDGATAEKDLAATLAGITKAYTITVAGQAATRDNAYAAAEVAYWSAEVSAKNDWRTDNADANVGYWTAQTVEHASSVLAVVSSQPSTLPWLEFQIDLSAAKRDWWIGIAADYLTWVSDVNAQHTTYQNTINTQYLLRAGALATADVTHATTLANAVESRDVGIATAEEQYVLTLAPPTETYVRAMAQAKRDYEVAVATAERDRAVNWDGTYQHAVAAAQDARYAAEEAARIAYASAEAASNGARRVSIATERRDFEFTAAGADVTFTASRGSAEKTYQTAEANAFATREINIAGLDANYWDHEAGTYANDMALLAVLSDTPWGEFEADRADADADWVAAVSADELSGNTTKANADKTAAIQAAAADQIFANGKAVARAAYRAGSATAVLWGNMAAAAADNALAALGFYTSELPVVPTPPTIAADPALTAAVDFDLNHYAYWKPFDICLNCNTGSNAAGLYGDHDFGWSYGPISGVFDARYTDLHTFGNFGDLAGTGYSSAWEWYSNWRITWNVSNVLWPVWTDWGAGLGYQENLLDGSLLRPKTPPTEPFANFNREDLTAAWEQISNSYHYTLPESFQSAAYVWTTFSQIRSSYDNQSTETGSGIYDAYQHFNPHEDQFTAAEIEHRIANAPARRDFLFAADGDPLDPDSPLAGTVFSAFRAQRFGNEAPASGAVAGGNNDSTLQGHQLRTIDLLRLAHSQQHIERPATPGEKLRAYLDGVLSQENAQFAIHFSQLLGNYKKNATLEWSEVPDFGKGFLYGFVVDGLWGQLKGFYDLAIFGWKASKFACYLDPQCRDAMQVFGYHFAAERELEAKLKTVAQIAYQAARIISVNTTLEASAQYHAIMNGSVEDLQALGGKHHQVAGFFMALAAKISEYPANMSAYDKGRVYGAVVYEVAQLVAEILLTAGLSKIATGSAKFAHIADKLADFGKYAHRFGPIAQEIAKWFDKGGELRKLLHKLDDIVDLASKAKKLMRGDIPVDVKDIKRLQDRGIPIEIGTPNSRRIIYEHNKIDPRGIGLDTIDEPANAVFRVEKNGNATIALRKDATRIELQEEFQHYEQFLRLKDKHVDKSPEKVADEWRRLLSSNKERAKMEIEAHQRVIDWLKANNGSTQELEAMNERLGYWMEKFYVAGGSIGELP